MKNQILKLLGRKDYVPANVPELLRALRQAPNKQQRLQSALKELQRTGQVARIKGNRWVLPLEADLVPGRIQLTRSGRGFLVPDAVGLGEMQIRAGNTGTAFPDDRVLVRRNVRPRGKRSESGHAETGTVVRVLERRRTCFVGTLKRTKRFLCVKPDDPRIRQDILVSPPRDVGRPARAGDKVMVELRSWESGNTAPEGVITEVLGPPTAEGVDMLSVLRQYDLPLKFPAKVLKEAKRFGTAINERDLAGRTDCRKDPVITIDPADAKDFDDAISLKRASKTEWKLRIHIADVSHYVKPGSALDKEALHRGNSTYLVDRVIPMLPEALSNELCSLKPEVDRLTKCVEFTIDNAGRVLRSRCYPAVIHSRRRFSYEEAFGVIEGKSGDALECMLRDADRLAQKIRRLRFKAGSLDLDFPESKIRLDDKGRVATIEKVEYDESHQLIEEFMLLANEAVASRLIRSRKASVHRVHERPDPARLREYREEVLSHNVPCGNLENPREVQKLLRRLNNLAIGPALKVGFLKSLMRARYATESPGHYGLAKKHYTHFTSPIRRYADLIVHRSLFGPGKQSETALREVADHISSTERNSADAERDSKSVKLYAYLTAQLKSGDPERYSALVTDVRNFGFFVDVSDLGMSGLVPLSILDDDFYEFDPVRVQVCGRRTRRVIKLGDRVEVQVAEVDDDLKRVDFRLASSGPPPRQSRRRTKASKSGAPRKGRAVSKSGPKRKAAGKPGRKRKAKAGPRKAR
jgi:ribonuclease R